MKTILNHLTTYLIKIEEEEEEEIKEQIKKKKKLSQ
jgi:hypothetical protein